MASKKPSPTKPQYAVVDDKFVAQTSEGEIKIPLRVKTGLVRRIRDLPGDELDQLFALLDGIGDKTTPAIIDELDFATETMPLSREFFVAWAGVQGATPGESSRSSATSRSTAQPSATTSDTASDSPSTT